jgi:Phytanoyl-CoA dioxygenase (PhyH)
MSEVAPIFKDPTLQKQFEMDGYAKIRLLDADKAQELYDYFINHQREHAVVDGLYHSTTHTNNPDLILAVDSYLKSMLLSELEPHFQNYEPMMCTYITKQPGVGSETIIHQDPTFVDESKFVSANIWVALHNINHDNGNLFFIKGTHRFIPSLRVTPGCPTAYDDVFDLLKENITEVPVNAGEAIVINHAVMHGATPNLSGKPRAAAVMAIRSAGSDWIFHYWEKGAPNDKIEKYLFDLDTFVNLKKDGKPENGKFIGHIQWDFPQITRKDFVKKLKETDTKSINSWSERLSVIRERLFS